MTPKSHTVLSVPLVDAAAEWLPRLDRRRPSRDDAPSCFPSSRRCGAAPGGQHGASSEAPVGTPT